MKRMAGAFAVFLVLAAAAGADEQPTAEQKKWLLEEGKAFATAEAGNGFEDLEPLRKMIGDARIVSLGESTHGSREIFQMKHRLMEFLAVEMGFTLFSIEASMPESYRVNDYVLHGKGDPAELIRGMYFWTWTTEEVRAMVEWMRAFNESGKGRVAFTGFDMQTPDVAARIVHDFVREADPEKAEAIGEIYGEVLEAASWRRSEFGTATGSFPIEAAAGKTVVFRSWIRTEDVTGWAGLWWRADKGNRSAAFVNQHLAGRAAKGTTEWQQYEVRLEIPEDIDGVYFGALLVGPGKAWFDGMTIEIDEEEYEDAERLDLDFESGELKGLNPAYGGYRTTIQKEGAHSGERCLRFECIAPDDTGKLTPAEAADAARKALRIVQEGRAGYVKKLSAMDVDWAIQNARVVLQCMEGRAGTVHRDRSMADNVRWIADRNPDAKIVLWAHNGHVARSARWMGAHLADEFGADYLPVGFATAKGKYSARGRGGGGLGAHELEAPPEGSVEWFLQAAGKPRLILDLRLAEPGAAGSGWLMEKRPFRSIGASVQDRQFFPEVVPDLFDLLIYIETTTPAVQMR